MTREKAGPLVGFILASAMTLGSICVGLDFLIAREWYDFGSFVLYTIIGATWTYVCGCAYLSTANRKS